MKKVLLFVAVIAAFSFVSCKKDFTCTCTTTATGYTGTPNVVTIVKAKKGDARAACLDTKQTAGGVEYTTDCELK